LGEEKVIGENHQSKTRGISSTTTGFELRGLILLAGNVTFFTRKKRKKYLLPPSFFSCTSSNLWDNECHDYIYRTKKLIFRITTG
jgi:hypothetical protein